MSIETRVDIDSIQEIPENFIVKFNDVKYLNYKKNKMNFEMNDEQKEFLEKLKDISKSKNNFSILSLKSIELKPKNEYVDIYFKIEKPKNKVLQLTLKNLIDIEKTILKEAIKKGEKTNLYSILNIL